MEKLIARINELSRKNKSVGLTEEEKAERDILREQYLTIFKNNFRNQLDSIEWTDEEPPLKH
ncbi:DUF896 domain-containing protein [Paenibacillus sp. GCM10012307]|uniref:DUF896 domain-containing protein n=1 Tax=Paenibacillus TaxID=44249 RepID=UPI002FCE51AB